MQRLTTNLLCLAWLAAVPAALLADEAAELPHAFEAGWKGLKTCELLYETAEVRVARCSFPPGVGHEKHYHNPHFGYVLEGGKMQITDASGEHEVLVEAGGTFTVPERIIHQGLNIGDTTTSYLMVEPRQPQP